MTYFLIAAGIGVLIAAGLWLREAGKQSIPVLRATAIAVAWRSDGVVWHAIPPPDAEPPTPDADRLLRAYDEAATR